MAIGHEQVGPAVVIDVQEESAPTQELPVYAQSGLRRYVGKGSVPIVVVERCRVVGEISANDIQPPVAVVIDSVGVHRHCRQYQPRLRFP